MKTILWTVCAVLLCVSMSEAGRFRVMQPGCAGGTCAVSSVPLPAATEVAVTWPWNKPPAPAPVVQPPAPAPAVVAVEVSAEVRRPVLRAAAAPVRAVGALAGAIHNREHKPAIKAVRAVVGRERRAARRQ